LDDAGSAAEIHRLAATSGALDMRGSGDFDGWRWWRGATRIVWLPPDSDVVYKIQIACDYSNEQEDENMRRWRGQAKAWAPSTRLIPVRDGDPILAMPYYPEQISSTDEIPDYIRAGSAADLPVDTRIENFRRAPNGQVMLIDAADVIPR
jgi:hypothetical protein